MYNEYEEIYEELCERVECDELTLEEVEVVNDYAYDLYVVDERSNFDRLIDGCTNEISKSSNRISKMCNKINGDTPDKIRSLLLNKSQSEISKIKKLGTINGLEIDPSVISTNRRNLTNSRRRLNGRIPDGMEIADKNYRMTKRKIKEALGDREQRPEERYKAGRYLKIQKAMR